MTEGNSGLLAAVTSAAPQCMAMNAAARAFERDEAAEAIASDVQGAHDQ